MRVVQTPRFKKVVKRLHANQKADLDLAVQTVTDQPLVGEAKLGDLAGVRVYKFHMVKQAALLAYVYDESSDALTLIALGTHENFYRDLKAC